LAPRHSNFNAPALAPMPHCRHSNFNAPALAPMKIM